MSGELSIFARKEVVALITSAFRAYEPRLREIIREEIVEDHVRHSGFTGELAEGYRASLLGELSAPTPSEAPHCG